MPAALTSEAMAQVGKAAAAGVNPTAQTHQFLNTIAARSPLQPEPFLVQAALAERAGQLDRAAELLKAARLRDPRSAAARYLLSEVLISQGKLEQGLGELAVLTHIMPDTSVQLVPALANYAKQPDARQNLGQILQINPRLKGPLLNALAADPSNADLILSLAGRNPSAEEGAKSWESRLLNGVLKQGDYGRAYAIWRELAGVPSSARPLLFNGDFRNSDAPPPFNWRLTSTAAGFAEPEGGSLRVIYYGRQDVALAAQVLLLAPGKYRFEAPLDGSAATDELQWTLTCGAGGNPLMQVQGGAGPSLFDVPSGCPVQTLLLRGVSQDSPSNVDVRIGPVAIEAVGR